ncbi:MAG TPA: substrate-binding domain-containing protein [Bryobacteraceae bacterium]|nr:substrate-binding domain-containing protein [Bryobacteraceae bacterium]
MRRASSALILLLTLAGCQNKQTKTIAVIPKGTSQVFWVSVQRGVLAAGQKYGVEIIWNGPSLETDYDRQIQIIDSMIARRVDAIAVAPAERKALAAPIERATSAGIPVTVFDSAVDSSSYMSYVATNNIEVGKMAARELGRLLNGQGDIAMLMNAPGSASTMEREKGFEQELGDKFPKVRLVARQYGMSDRSRAMGVAENILTAQPALNGIFASSEASGIGCALALKARGLSGKVKLVAVDASDSMVEDLRAGTISSLVAQDPYRMGFSAVETLVNKLRGQTPPRQIDLPATLITKVNLDSPEVQKLLKPANLPAVR